MNEILIFSFGRLPCKNGFRIPILHVIKIPKQIGNIGGMVKHHYLIHKSLLHFKFQFSREFDLLIKLA